MLADQTTTLSPTGSETLDVGGRQVVVTDGHAVLPEGMTHLPDRAFRNRTSLVSVAFSRSLASIGDCAFEGCSALTSITLPAGLTSIGKGAFHSCSSLARITVPTTATVDDEAFEPETTVLRLPPANMRHIERWYEAADFVLAYKRCRPLLYGWLERAQNKLGSYGPDGAARQRDREAFEGDFGPAASSSGA
ncbi:hypothetical protein EMIHUDRAFT_251672 [Emiliania huxleyi CCMP1516]|uniref:Leucine-rich repeat domain-containing protein n=2 Tax=Emiliania huxleyi TaxID=2903 RepID=A0A0D3KSJ0_EMIH1|nr:hypothetical protein EMIHUDRAFT_251672 [Emiliania huxleyi CCMP1516]EOD38725.1 hypothetical protein EMIHUDRAFT_251672 [Emiliania huxleyi CCMP1516]|eukprot:XP_005791154.1 hypothetical protein EMIHUDRAFT_251672 [Emiliania huxleyi CCMP1516]